MVLKNNTDLQLGEMLRVVCEADDRVGDMFGLNVVCWVLSFFWKETEGSEHDLLENAYWSLFECNGQSLYVFSKEALL